MRNPSFFTFLVWLIAARQYTSLDQQRDLHDKDISRISGDLFLSDTISVLPVNVAAAANISTTNTSIIFYSHFS